MDYLYDLYLGFRMIFNELLKQNIDLTKEESDFEHEQFRKLANEYMPELVSAEDFLRKLHVDGLRYDIIKETDDSDTKSNISIPSVNLITALKQLKEKNQEINIVWLLKDSGAVLDGHRLTPDGQDNRHAKKDFINLMDKLEFPKNVQRIFIKENINGKGYLRFNALSHPEVFLNDMVNLLSENPLNINIKQIHYKKNSWLYQYDKLVELLRLWSDNNSQEAINFIKYRKTKELLLLLIPITNEDNSLKSIEKYSEDRKMIQDTIFEYYKKKTMHIDDQYMQGMDLLSPIIKDIESYVDFVYMGHFHAIQKDILMDALLSTLQIESLHKLIKLLLDQAITYQNAYNNPDNPKPYRYYQDMWDGIRDVKDF